jgi:hypothetical protein
MALTETEELELLELEELEAGAPAATPTMNQLPAQPPQDEEVSWGSAVANLPVSAAAGTNRAAFDLVDLPVNALNLIPQGINAVAGTDLPLGMLPSQMAGARELKEKAANLSPEANKSALNQATFRGAQWLSPTGAGTKTAALAPAAGAAIASDIGRRVNDETGANVGEVAGGLTGMGAPSAVGLVKRGVSYLSNLLSGGEKVLKATEIGDVKAVTDLLATHATYPEVVNARLQEAINSGDKGPLAEILNDPGIADLTKSRALGSNALADQLRSLVTGREDALLNDISNLAPGTPAPRQLQAQAQGDINRVADAIQTQEQTRLAPVAMAETAAVQEQGKQIGEQAANVASEQKGLAQVRAQLETSTAPGKASGEVFSEYERLSTDLGAEVNDLYKAFRESDTVDATAMQGKMAEFIDNLNPVMQQEVVRKFSKELGYVGKLGGKGAEAEPADIQAIMSLVGTRLNEAKVSGNYGSTEKLMGDLNTTMKDFLRGETQTGYKEATDAAASMKARTEPNLIEQARRQGEPGLFVGKAGGFRGPSGGVLAGKFADSKDPTIVAKGEDALRSDLQDGLDDPAGLLKNGQYREALDAYPTLKAQVTDLAASQLRLAMAEDAAKVGTAAANAELKAAQVGFDAQRKAISKEAGLRQAKIKSSELTKFIKSPDKYINTQLNANISTTDVQDRMKRLHSAAKRFGGEELLKRELLNSVKNLVAPEAVASRRLTSAALDKFNAMRPTLESSDALSKQELDFIESTLGRGQRATELTANASVSRASGLAHGSPEAANLIASIAAMAGSKVIGSASSLMINGAMRRYALRTAKNLSTRGDPAKLALLDSYLANPAKFEKDLKAVNPDAFERVIRSGSEEEFAEYMTVMNRNTVKASQVLADGDMTAPEEE